MVFVVLFFHIKSMIYIIQKLSASGLLYVSLLGCYLVFIQKLNITDYIVMND